MKFWKQKTFKRKVIKTVSGAVGGFLAGGPIGSVVGAAAGGFSGGKGKVLKNIGIGGGAGLAGGLGAQALGVQGSTTFLGFKPLSSYVYSGLASIGKGPVPAAAAETDKVPSDGATAPSTPFYSDLFKTLTPIPATSTPAEEIRRSTDSALPDNYAPGTADQGAESWLPLALAGGALLLVGSL